MTSKVWVGMTVYASISIVGINDMFCSFRLSGFGGGSDCRGEPASALQWGKPGKQRASQTIGSGGAMDAMRHNNEC